MDGCFACDLLAGRQELPGGTIYRTALWAVEHCVGPVGLGALVVKPVRHVTRVAELDDAEAEAFGPLLRRTAAIVDELIRPEQVYTWLFSHMGRVPVHIHWVVQPATTEAIDAVGGHGPHLVAGMFKREEYPARDAIDAFAEHARAAFATAV
jgi:diadenosine tetraphosphate (Ap4A) HIT family hydrolase